MDRIRKSHLSESRQHKSLKTLLYRTDTLKKTRSIGSFVVIKVIKREDVVSNHCFTFYSIVSVLMLTMFFAWLPSSMWDSS